MNFKEFLTEYWWVAIGVFVIINLLWYANSGAVVLSKTINIKELFT